MIIRGFSKDDLLRIKVQPEQQHEMNFAGLPSQSSFTFEQDGKVLGVFGFAEMYRGRGAVFAFVSAEAGRYMTAVVRALKRIIDSGMPYYGFERLEMSVLDGFFQGERMAEMLGFEYEGMMRKYFKGRNYKLFARVK